MFVRKRNYVSSNGSCFSVDVPVNILYISTKTYIYYYSHVLIVVNSVENPDNQSTDTSVNVYRMHMYVRARSAYMCIWQEGTFCCIVCVCLRVRRVCVRVYVGAYHAYMRAYDMCVTLNHLALTPPLRQSWTNDSYEAATTETFAKSNVVIDGPGLDTPATWTYGDCGEPGEFIHIPI